MKLLQAHHFMQDYIREGIPVWWDESDDVFFEAERRTSRSRAEIERAQQFDTKGKDAKPVPGRYYVPVPKTRGDAPFPTFADWVTEQRRKKGEKV